mgnify:CR=1 FL=1
MPSSGVQNSSLRKDFEAVIGTASHHSLIDSRPASGFKQRRGRLFLYVAITATSLRGSDREVAQIFTEALLSVSAPLCSGAPHGPGESAHPLLV